VQIYTFFSILYYFTKKYLLHNLLFKKKWGGEDCDVLLFLSGSLHELFGNLFNHMEYSGVRVCAHTFAAKDGGTRITQIARIFCWRTSLCHTDSTDLSRSPSRAGGNQPGRWQRLPRLQAAPRGWQQPATRLAAGLHLPCYILPPPLLLPSYLLATPRLPLPYPRITLELP